MNEEKTILSLLNESKNGVVCTDPSGDPLVPGALTFFQERARDFAEDGTEYADPVRGWQITICKVRLEQKRQHFVLENYVFQFKAFENSEPKLKRLRFWI